MTAPLWLMDFCRACGELLPEGLGLLPKEKKLCPFCSENVTATTTRVQGVFREADATALRKALRKRKEP